MTTSISISRLRKIVAEADAAYATSREAMEGVRDAKSTVRAIEARINPKTGVDGVYETKNWDHVPRADWPPGYREAREALAEAEAAVSRQSEITQHAGRMKTRALEFARLHRIALPADLGGKF
ncbi:hypothetical protein [Mesorhizobium sp.]|uniref:hypothetical protein n=1 Tax=Mesorhizobium sp. TaxID=1871066 RepID=UPI000FE96739|nr:hypothetical protein [Mesorhizobium sp.]RWD70874.1 MAG: hypothetical protein EOS37_13230 [Mesorhizobium sp.]